MIRHVTFDDSTWNRPPRKFEAGTPPIAEEIVLAAAADYLDAIGMETIADHENGTGPVHHRTTKTSRGPNSLWRSSR